jgi:poly(3-hydroxybutyrate) depolymerase
MKLLLLNLLSLAAPAVYAQTTNVDYCNTGPDSITESLLSTNGFSANVPRTCVAATGSQGGERCFFTYVPDCAGVNSPLVFDIHGTGSCPLFSTTYTGWIQRAKDECFVLVMPLGTIDPDVATASCFGLPGGMPAGDGLAQETIPCCCAKGDPTNTSDLIDASITNDADLMRLIAKTAIEQVPVETEDRVTIDTKRIYMAGHSNGCITSLSMAALHSDMVAAVCAATPGSAFRILQRITPLFQFGWPTAKKMSRCPWRDFKSVPLCFNQAHRMSFLYLPTRTDAKRPRLCRWCHLWMETMLLEVSRLVPIATTEQKLQL